MSNRADNLNDSRTNSKSWSLLNLRLHCCKTKCCCKITTILLLLLNLIKPVTSNDQVHLCCLLNVFVFLSLMSKFAAAIIFSWMTRELASLCWKMVVRHEAIIANVAPDILDTLPDNVITISVAWTQATHLAVILFPRKLLIFNARHNVTWI